MENHGKTLKEKEKSSNIENILRRIYGRVIIVKKKNFNKYRTAKQLKELALSNKFTDSEFQTMLHRSEEFKSIRFKKRERKND